jgi:hypothetical protein
MNPPQGNNSRHRDNGRVVERIIENHGNGGFAKLKDTVFLAVILAAGAIIWAQQRSIDKIETDIAVLNLKCIDKPLLRGGPGE